MATERELRNRVVSIMLGWLGYSEANGKHREIIDLYNSHKPLARGYKVRYTDEWCATTVSAAFIKAGLTDIAPTECSCTAMIGLYKAMGRWEESDAYRPECGDILMYAWKDSGAGDCSLSPDHVGIVTDVTGNIITVIEGNKGDMVSFRKMPVNGRYIRGYCLPDYRSKAKEDVDMNCYKTIGDVPSAYRSAVEKAVKAGVLNGYGGGVLNISEDLCRMLVILDRLGLL